MQKARQKVLHSLFSFIQILVTIVVDHAYLTNFLRDCVVIESHHPLQLTLVWSKLEKGLFSIVYEYGRNFLCYLHSNRLSL